MAGDENLLAKYDPLGENVDLPAFEQILEMDDDDSEREFSRGIVFGFFDQADQTFENMDKGLKQKELDTLSSLGHFLKGSAATIGLTKVRDSCEKIQHFGKHNDEQGNPTDWSDETCLDLIDKTLKRAREDYARAEQILRGFYKADSS